MFIEGFYLHNTVVVAVFQEAPKLWKYLLIGWGKIILKALSALSLHVDGSRSPIDTCHDMAGGFGTEARDRTVRTSPVLLEQRVKTGSFPFRCLGLYYLHPEFWIMDAIRLSELVVSDFLLKER